jgi:hypothetical protein
MKLAILAIIAFVLAIAWGAQSVFIGIRDRTLIEITCADYLADPPAGRWVKLVECELDFENTLVREVDGRVDAVFVPMRPRGVTDGPARLVVETDGEAIPRGTHTVQGMMRIGVMNEPSDEFLAKLARTARTSPNARVMWLGDEPNIWLGVLALIGGLAGLAVTWLLVRRVR